MKEIHIMEAVSENIHSKIFDEWKHEGFIGCWNSEYINFEIDNKEYVLTLREVKDGEMWTDVGTLGKEAKDDSKQQRKR